MTDRAIRLDQHRGMSSGDSSLRRRKEQLRLRHEGGIGKVVRYHRVELARSRREGALSAHRHSVVAAHRRVAAERDNNKDLGP